MKIYYFSPYDILRARTNSISDVRMCEGFSANNCHVKLFSPYIYRKDNISLQEVNDFYGIISPYQITINKTPFWDTTPKWLAIPVMWIVNFFSVIKLLFTNRKNFSDVVIMSRSIDLLIPSILIKRFLKLKDGPKIITWAHEVIYKQRYQWVYKKSDAVIGTNSAITEDLNRKIGIAKNKLFITLNPITEKQITTAITRSEARKILNINFDNPLVVYTGKLYVNQKEIEYILETARKLPACLFLLTGGKPEVVKYYKEFCGENNIGNITFTGFLHRYEDVQYYQYAADILVSYYSRHDHLVRYNLPNKICEYMLTRNPIVTVKFDAIKDVLNSTNAIFVDPEDPSALSDGITFSLEHPAKSAQLADKAFDDVKEMTFTKRTKLVIDFFDTL